MSKQRGANGEKNLIASRLIALRQVKGLSQRDLAGQLQVCGLDVDKNVITRIETQKRYVTDLELKVISKFFGVSYEYLVDGKVSSTSVVEQNASQTEIELSKRNH